MNIKSLDAAKTRFQIERGDVQYMIAYLQDGIQISGAPGAIQLAENGHNVLEIYGERSTYYVEVESILAVAFRC